MLKVMKKPTAFSNKVRKLLIELIKGDFEDFDESRLKYCFVSPCGRDEYTGYTSVIYFKYTLDEIGEQYRVYDIGYELTQNSLRGKLEIQRGCSQATYFLTNAGN